MDPSRLSHIRFFVIDSVVAGVTRASRAVRAARPAWQPQASNRLPAGGPDAPGRKDNAQARCCGRTGRTGETGRTGRTGETGQLAVR
jgi:hypothetical protein